MFSSVIGFVGSFFGIVPPTAPRTGDPPPFLLFQLLLYPVPTITIRATIVIVE